MPSKNIDSFDDLEISINIICRSYETWIHIKYLKADQENFCS